MSGEWRLRVAPVAQLKALDSGQRAIAGDWEHWPQVFSRYGREVYPARSVLDCGADRLIEKSDALHCLNRWVKAALRERAGEDPAGRRWRGDENRSASRIPDAPGATVAGFLLPNLPRRSGKSVEASVEISAGMGRNDLDTGFSFLELDSVWTSPRYRTPFLTRQIHAKLHATHRSRWNRSRCLLAAICRLVGAAGKLPQAGRDRQRRRSPDAKRNQSKSA
jgi:hypothetical protein